jgi:hypothetical protein
VVEIENNGQGTINRLISIDNDKDIKNKEFKQASKFKERKKKCMYSQTNERNKQKIEPLSSKHRFPGYLPV